VGVNYTIIAVDFASHYCVSRENRSNNRPHFEDRHTTGEKPNSHPRHCMEHEQRMAEITQNYIT